MSSNKLFTAVYALRDDSQVAGLSRFFKCGPGQYGEGDRFLGIKVPVQRELVKQIWKDVSLQDLEETICSPYHELRMTSLLILVEIFTHAKKNPDLQKACVDFYLSHTAYINNWDLVDLSCYPILGKWLMDKDRSLLYDFARNGKTIWEQRIGIVSTMYFIRSGELDDCYAIAQIFLDKKEPLHDLLQKAVGWLVRESGKRDEQRLRAWLEPRYKSMPRTMLRYAIEKLPPSDREHFMTK